MKLVAIMALGAGALVALTPARSDAQVPTQAQAQLPGGLPPGMTADQLALLLQQNPQLASLLRQRLQQSGLTPDQVRAQLAANGYPANLLDAYLGPAQPASAAGASSTRVLGVLQALGLTTGADSLYADLYGLKDDGGERRSLLRYFEGRSSLGSWLRAVLAQRYVDRIRAQKRFDALPDENMAGSGTSPRAPHASADAGPDPDRQRYVTLLRGALGCAVARLSSRLAAVNSCARARPGSSAMSAPPSSPCERSKHDPARASRTRRICRIALERRFVARSGQSWL